MYCRPSPSRAPRPSRNSRRSCLSGCAAPVHDRRGAQDADPGAGVDAPGRPPPATSRVTSVSRAWPRVSALSVSTWSPWSPYQLMPLPARNAGAARRAGDRLGQHPGGDHPALAQLARPTSSSAGCRRSGVPARLTTTSARLDDVAVVGRRRTGPTSTRRRPGPDDGPAGSPCGRARPSSSVRWVPRKPDAPAITICMPPPSQTPGNPPTRRLSTRTSPTRRLSRVNKRRVVAAGASTATVGVWASHATGRALRPRTGRTRGAA